MTEDPRAPRQPRIRQAGELRTGQLPANRRLRIARLRPLQIPVPKRSVPRPAWHPALVFVYGFAGLILAGATILSLPVSSVSGEWTPFLDALFTATSAVCVTGLVVVDTGTYWSGFGQAVILLLIQAGGLGYMTSSILLLLIIGHRVTLRERVLLQQSFGGGSLESIVSVVRRVALFTIGAEVVGGIILTAFFLTELQPLHALWWGVFHAISAFNNAGFDVIGGNRSLVPFNHQPIVVLTIAALLILGGISFSVVDDLARTRRFVRLTLDTKLVLITTLALLILGMVGVLFTELRNPATLGEMALGPQLMNAFFTGVTPRTAGFNSIDTGAMTEDGLLVVIALMFVGGAAGSTAGGIKVQTFSLLLFAIVSAARGASEVEAFRRRVSMPHILRAIAVALISIALVFTVFFALNLSEDFAFIRVLFEAFSAFGTVGLSTGITPDLSPAGRAIVILTMFAGRLGPLTLVVALAARERRALYRWPEATARIG